MPRRKKAIAIDLRDLVTALDDHSGLSWYLDTKTGDILPVPDDADDDVLPVSREGLDESDRFLFIEPLESRSGWEEMRDFAGRVSDRRLKGLLEVALAGKGAFGRFRAVLADYPEERARWFAEHEKHMEDQARVWLDREGLTWTTREGAASAGSPAEAGGDQRRAQGEASPRAGARSPRAGCELCTENARNALPWIEVHPEGEGVSVVRVDVTLRLCADHRRRLLAALDKKDSDTIELPTNSWNK